MFKRQSHFRYLELSAILRSQIMTGYLKPGDFLLPENELTHKYELSRTSVRKALQELLDEGLIVKMAGKGSIVNPDLPPLAPGANRLTIMAPHPSYFSEGALPIIVKMFKDRHPYIDLNVVSLPYESGNFLKELGKVGLKPDLVLVTDREYRQMELGDFADLSGMIDGDEDVPRKVTDAFRKDGRLVAVPLTYSPIVLLYDREQFARQGVSLPDEDWELTKFLGAMAALTRDTDGDGVTDTYGIGVSSHISRWLDFALKNGVGFDPEPDEQALAETLEFLRNLLYRDRVSPVYPLSDLEQINEMFEQRKLATQLTSLLVVKGVDRVRTGITQIPFGSRRCKMLIANGMMLYTNGDNTEYAKLFLQFILSRDVQRKWMDSTDMLSIYRSINYEYWGTEVMRTLDISEEDRFLFELFADMSVIDDLEREMRMFWTGTELPSATARKMKQLLSAR